MKRFAIIIGLCVVVFFLAKVLEYVFEYYDLHWTRVRCNKGRNR